MLEVILCGFLDRVRGDKFNLISKLIEKLTYGWIIASLLGHPLDYDTIYISVAFAAGISPGWGQPIGEALGNERKRYHWYEVGIVRRSVWLSLAVRGFIVGALLLPIYPIVSVVYIVAFPLAVLIAKYLPKINKFEYQEYFRGWIAGLLIYIERAFNG